MRRSLAVPLLLAVLLAAGLVLLGPMGLLDPDRGEEDAPASPRAALAGEPGGAPATAEPGSEAPRLEGPEAPPAPAAAPEPAGPRVRGRVVDRSGAGIAGARVAAVPDTTRKSFALDGLAAPDVRGSSATTGADGRFVVAVRADAPFHLLYVAAPGFSLGVRTEVAADDDVTIVLEPALALVGTVRDRADRPVAGATVRVSFLADLVELRADATTGADGTYRVSDLPSPAARPRTALWFLRSWTEVTAEGFAPLLVEDVHADAKGGETRRDFTLSRGATLAGRVTRQDTGEPVAGARVVLWSIEGMQAFGRPGGGHVTNPWAPRRLQETTTTTDGSYVFEHVPCAGPHGSASHNSMGAGKRALGGVGAWKEGLAAASANVEVADDGARLEKDLVLWPSGSISGRVVESTGTPVSDATVGASVEGRPSQTYVPDLYSDVPSSWARTGPDGRFRISAVGTSTPGPDEVGVKVWSAARRSGAQEPVAKVRLSPGETYDVGDLVLPATEPVPTTTLLVRGADGRPLFGATVSRSSWRTSQAPRTDAEGRVEWAWPPPRPGVPLGPTEVVVRARGFAPTVVLLPAPSHGAEPVHVALEPGRRVAGRVLLPDGSPAASRIVEVGDGSVALEIVFPEPVGGFLQEPVLPGRTMPLQHGSTLTDQDGRFEFVDLPDGPYHLRASMPRRVVEFGRNTVRAFSSGVVAGSTDVVLRFPPDDSPPTGTVSGRVSPVEPGVRVGLLRGATWVASARRGGDGMVPMGPGAAAIGDDGTFTMLNVPVGTYVLEAGGTGYRSTRVEGVEVTADATTRVAPVTLDRGVEVSGRLSGFSPSGRVWFVADAPPRRVIPAKVEADGSYVATGFTVGEYRLEVQPGGPKDPPLVPVDERRLVVREGAATVRFDVDLVAAGYVIVAFKDTRLPPSPWDGRATSEQAAFGAASRLVVRRDGPALYERVGVDRTGTSIAVLPGTYVVRLEHPGGEVREERTEVAAGGQATVTFGPR